MHRSKLELSWAFYMRAEAIFSSLLQASPIQRERPASPYMRGPALAFSSSIMVTAAPAAAIRAPEGLRITTSASTCQSSHAPRSQTGCSWTARWEGWGLWHAGEKDRRVQGTIEVDWGRGGRGSTGGLWEAR